VVQPDDWIMDDGDFWRKPRPYKHLGQTGAAPRSVSLYIPTPYVNCKIFHLWHEIIFQNFPSFCLTLADNKCRITAHER
jgi:hypothetical protein